MVIDDNCMGMGLLMTLAWKCCHFLQLYGNIISDDTCMEI